jgi:hypothetical protein
MTAGHDPVHLVKHSPERRRGSLKSGSTPVRGRAVRTDSRTARACHLLENGVGIATEEDGMLQ